MDEKIVPFLHPDRHDLDDLILGKNVEEDPKRLNAELPLCQLVGPKPLPISRSPGRLMHN